jgi:hypothetical protein
MCYFYLKALFFLPTAKSPKSNVTLLPSRKRIAIAASRPGLPSKASRLVAEAFDAVPTVFGRLVLAAYMLHRDTGLYVCPLASVAYGYDEVNLLLSQAHKQMLSDWLAMKPEEQASDLQGYLWAVDDQRDALAGSIHRKRSYAAILPLSTDANDRKSFMAGVDLALKAGRERLRPVPRTARS